MYQENRTCDVCKATYLNGTRHTCDNNDLNFARNRLEAWLGDFVIEK